MKMTENNAVKFVLDDELSFGAAGRNRDRDRERDRDRDGAFTMEESKSVDFKQTFEF